MDERHEHRHGYLSMKPTEYFGRQCYVAIDAGEEPAKYSLDPVGDENFVFSTDYPHPDASYPFATDMLLELPIAEDSKRKVVWDNCAKLHGVAGWPLLIHHEV